MSEKNEKTQNINNNGGKGKHHKHRYNHNKHKGPRPQQNATVENQSDGVTQKNNGNRPNQNENRQKHNNKNRKNNRDQKTVQPQSEPSAFADTLDADPIFGGSPFSSFTKEKKEPKTYTDHSDVRQFSDDELFGTSHLINTNEVDENATVEIVGVKFKSTGKSYYFDPNGITFSVGECAILETARGLEFGEICIANKNVSEANIVQPLRKALRKATKEDIAHHESNKQREKEAFNIALDKIAFHKLDMKLVEAQYSFDNTKLLFYFTSAGRVDFRELVSDLASVFKTRIELRQIGIRDEAKMLGGIGMCGRTLCCSRYLSNFAQVSIKMAKEQGLSLNSNKISGNCGRLMCCLNFENQVYLDEIKITPMPGSIVKVDGGKGVVTDANPLTGMIKVHLDGAPEGEKISTHRDKVVIISRKAVDVSTENDTAEAVPEE